MSEHSQVMTLLIVMFCCLCYLVGDVRWEVQQIRREIKKLNGEAKDDQAATANRV
jgi:hypothetical protein